MLFFFKRVFLLTFFISLCFFHPLDNLSDNNFQKTFKAELTEGVEVSNTNKKKLAAIGLSGLFSGAGQFYLGTKYSWQSENKIFKGVVIPKFSSVDINDAEDWKFAKFLFQSNK